MGCPRAIATWTCGAGRGGRRFTAAPPGLTEVLRDLGANRHGSRRRVPEIGRLSSTRDQTNLAGFVQPLEHGVDRRKVARVLRKVEPDARQTIADVHRRHRDARPQHEATAIGETEGDGRRQTEQARQRADGLSELGQTLVDLPASFTE